MKTLICNSTIVNEDASFKGCVLIDNDRISRVFDEATADAEELNELRRSADNVVDAEGGYLLPGVIDSHVHFREPGLTHKACIESESRAAAYGGVTTYFDMPNTVPQTTTLVALAGKFELAQRDSHVNYSFFFGATNDNANLLPELDKRTIPGIKLFMGSSTGNMLVDKDESLNSIFSAASQLGMPIMAHCEDTDIINSNVSALKEQYHSDDLPVETHPEIRSVEACYESSRKAVAMAEKYGTRLHLAHLTTARELSLLDAAKPNVTAEVTPAHLIFSSEDYAVLGTRIKCNPAVKSIDNREALRTALAGGLISTIGTDHAPHLLTEKEGGALKAVSGMPMIQFSLVSMLSLVDEKVLTVEQVVRLMAHNPAELFGVRDRGFIREGYFADLAIVRNDDSWTLSGSDIVSRCGWSPLEGRTFNWKVKHTFCNGQHIYDNGYFDESFRGSQVEFKSKESKSLKV